MSPTAVGAMDDDADRGRLSIDNPAVADVTVADFILDGRPMDADVVDALVDVGINRAIEGASTLTATVTDTDLKLLNSPVFAKAVDLWLDDLAFRLADIDLADDDGGPELQLVLEARAVARLRLFNKPMAASRADKTRAEFIKGMCDEASVPFVCPQLHKRQPIKKKTDQQTKKDKDKARHPGIKTSASLTIKGVQADSGQIRQLERALDVANSLKASELASQALVCAGIGESGFRAVRNQGNPPSKYAGVFQADPANIPMDDTEQQAHYFLTGGKGFQQGGAMALAQAHPDMAPGEIATRVEASGEPANFYNVWLDEAQKIIAAYGGGSLSAIAGEPAAEYAVAFMFRRGSEDGTKREDSWTCMRRLANEVNWRLWEDAGTVYFMTDDDILRSRVRHTIMPGAEGVDSVTGRISTRKPLQEVTVACHARRWQAPPATVVEVEGYGRFDGRWIVATINRPSVFANATTITLHRRQAVKLEPAHDTRTRQTGDTSGGTSVAEAKAGDVVIAPGANAPDRPLSPDLLQFAKLMAGVYGAPLIITTGTNHDKYSTSGLISDHFSGNAADFGMVANHGTDLGPVGDKIATAALIVAGVSSDKAPGIAGRRGRAGFHELYYDGFKIQILWGFNIRELGGNHTNHVHVGVKRTAAANPSTYGTSPGVSTPAAKRPPVEDQQKGNKQVIPANP